MKLHYRSMSPTELTDLITRLRRLKISKPLNTTDHSDPIHRAIQVATRELRLKQ
jgi:hypothetical protein